MRLGSYPIKLVKNTLAYDIYGSEIIYEDIDIDMKLILIILKYYKSTV